jgi:hypothetical protein
MSEHQRLFLTEENDQPKRADILPPPPPALDVGAIRSDRWQSIGWIALGFAPIVLLILALFSSK